VRNRFALVSLVAACAVGALARPARAQYVMERHSAVAADSAGVTALRALRADLTRLRLAQDSFYVAHQSYAADTAALGGWRSTSGALFRITRADSTSWVAEAEHRQLVGAEVLTVRRTGDQPRRP
jgi:hypothetical protein